MPPNSGKSQMRPREAVYGCESRSARRQNMATHTLLASLLVLTTTARPAFLVLLGSLFLLRIPHLYWSMRGRYERVNSVDGVGASQTILRYAGGSQMGREHGGWSPWEWPVLEPA